MSVSLTVRLCLCIFTSSSSFLHWPVLQKTNCKTHTTFSSLKKNIAQLGDLFHHSFSPNNQHGFSQNSSPHPLLWRSVPRWHRKNKGDIQGQQCECSETIFALCFFREALQSHTILKSEISEELLRSLDGRPWHLRSLQKSLFSCIFPTVHWTPLQFSKFTLCLCGHVWQDLKHWQS